jgi:hypothetical protein
MLRAGRFQSEERARLHGLARDECEAALICEQAPCARRDICRGIDDDSYEWRGSGLIIVSFGRHRVRDGIVKRVIERRGQTARGSAGEPRRIHGQPRAGVSVRRHDRDTCENRRNLELHSQLSGVLTNKGKHAT